MQQSELHRGRRADGTHDVLRSPSHAPANGFETPSSRAMRVALARAFPVRIAPMREALVSGSITKLARP
jgi:hypothetical protein